MSQQISGLKKVITLKYFVIWNILKTITWGYFFLLSDITNNNLFDEWFDFWQENSIQITIYRKFIIIFPGLTRYQQKSFWDLLWIFKKNINTFPNKITICSKQRQTIYTAHLIEQLQFRYYVMVWYVLPSQKKFWILFLWFLRSWFWNQKRSYLGTTCTY